MPQQRPFIPEDILRLHTITDPQVSPDGARVAFTRTRVDRERDEYRSQVYLIAMSGGTPARWTNGPKRDSQPRWSPDGRYLAFVRELPDEKPQIYVMRRDGGDAWQLTDLPQGAGNPVWSPDSQRLAFVAATGGDSRPEKEKTETEKHRPRVVEHLNYKFDGTGHLDGRKSHIFTVAVDTDFPDRLPEATQITDGDWDDSQPCWSPDGTEIAFVSYRESDRHRVLWMSDIWVVAASGGEPRKLTQSRGPVNMPAWSPDGDWIAYSGHERGVSGLAYTLHVYVIAAAGGESRNLTAMLDRHVAGPLTPPANALSWAPDSSGVYFLAMDRGNVPLFLTSLDGDVKPVVAGERQVTGFSLSRDGKDIAFTVTCPFFPSDLFVAGATGAERRLTEVNQDVLQETALGTVERISFRGAAGREIEGWAVRPPDFDPNTPYPTILDIHGGPHGQYGTAFMPGVHALAGAGFLVLYVNPHGSTGYGEEFALGCIDDWGGKDFEDLMRGLDHVIGLGWSDADRLGVTGYSYGGFMTLWAIGHSDRFRAAVAGACLSNAYSMWGTSDIGPQFMQYELGGSRPHEAPDAWLARSPVHHLAACTTPLLLLHHEGDLRCPIAQSEEAFALLRSLDREAVMVRYPGGFHTYLTHAPSQHVDAMQRTTAWFQQYLHASPVEQRSANGRE